MRRFFNILFILSIAGILNSCSKEKKLERRLLGSWSIDRYEITFTDMDNGSTRSYSYKDFGSMSFSDDNTGSANYNHSKKEFIWSNTDASLTIEDKAEPKIKIVYSIAINEKKFQALEANYITSFGMHVRETLNLTKN